MSTIKDFVTTMKTASDEKTKAYDTTATVTRIEGNTAWVHIPGGVDETPVKMTIKAKAGDAVQVRVSSGKAFLVGNATAPPTDDTRAIGAARMASSAEDAARIAHAAANDAQESADRAYTAAEEAQASANRAYASAVNASDYASRALGSLSTVQSVAETLTWITQHGTMTLTTDTELDPTHVYFVQDSTGDYVVGNVHYSLVTEPNVDDLSTYYELTIDESLNNYVGTHLALTGEGLWLLPASSGTSKVLIATGAGTTYTTAGTYIIDNTGGIVASFRADGAQIGQADLMHIVMSVDSFIMGDAQGQEIAHIGSPTTPEFTDTFFYMGSAGSSFTVTLTHTPTANPTVKINGTATTKYTRSGKTVIIQASASLAYGDVVTATYTTNEQLSFYTFGKRTGDAGDYSFAEGLNTTASGPVSHAEGTAAKAYGYASHAEGNGSEAYGYASHAEGFDGVAIGRFAHAEGYNTRAYGEGSHAQNLQTIAEGQAQTVIGKYNIKDAVSLFIIGNGSSSARSNAFIIDSNGNIRAKGDIYLGCNNDSTGGTKLSSAIGTVKNVYASAKSVATGTNTNLCSVSLEAGTWIVTAGVRFPANATGLRRMNISTASGSANADVQMPAASGGSTQMAYTVILSPTSTTTYYLNCYHNAGTTLNLVAGGGENGLNFIRAIRIL